MPTFSQPAFSQPAFHNQSIYFSQTCFSQQFQTASYISANNAKFLILEKDKYEIWAMKIGVWIQNDDHIFGGLFRRISPKRFYMKITIADFHHIGCAKGYFVIAVEGSLVGNEESKEAEEDHAHTAGCNVKELLMIRLGILPLKDTEVKTDEQKLWSQLIHGELSIMRQKTRRVEDVENGIYGMMAGEYHADIWWCCVSEAAAVFAMMGFLLRYKIIPLGL
ncbi:hypothetical protein Tco_0214958 [Tanacetum coccineum]